MKITLSILRILIGLSGIGFIFTLFFISGLIREGNFLFDLFFVAFYFVAPVTFPLILFFGLFFEYFKLGVEPSLLLRLFSVLVYGILFIVFWKIYKKISKSQNIDMSKYKGL